MQRHDLTPTVSPIPIALPASVPPALFQLVLTPPSSGANIAASTALSIIEHYRPGNNAAAQSTKLEKYVSLRIGL
ncbi:hypothetical protein TNCV_1617721 [Trichonephila clavipes]|nr:hypothetical protein TNCV_1617721 [Trichonephila clavipes]